MKSNFFHMHILRCLLLAGLVGCTKTSLPTQPDIEYPASFTQGQATEPQSKEAQSKESQFAESQSISKIWWDAFESPELNLLLQEANEQSLDLQITRERVRQAEYQLRIANASWFPSVNLDASTGEARTKASGLTARSDSTRANVSMSYELDIWGGVAAGRRAAKADYDAIRFDQESAQLSTRAAIATGWFQWLALQERILTAEKNIAIAERIMGIVDARYRNGSASAAEVAQQQTNLLSQRASLLPLQLQARQSRSALAILLGKTPQVITLPEAQLNQLRVPVIAPGTPANLVLRRPDLAAAEADLLAADADVVQARAALLPSITLAASAGKTASELFSLNPATQVSGWSLGLAQTLFSGGRLVNQKKYQEARRAELLLQYHRAILVSLQEVDNALVAADNSDLQEQSQQAILVQAERSLRLTEVRYREGSDELLSLLAAQRSLFQVQDNLVQQRLARLSAAVDLYKALGGGWQLTP